MNHLRQLVCALVAACFLASPACPNAPTGGDQSDLWWIPAESGWGMQLVHRGSVIFATLFVYGPDGTPTWYSATINPTGAPFTWSGDLYATAGPWFVTVPFNPALVTATKVGTMTWNGAYIEIGVVTYTVNGVTITKNVTRQTLVNENYGGTYSGEFHDAVTQCINPALDGTSEIPVTLQITQGNGSTTVYIAATFQGGNACNYTGNLTQSGQMGRIRGNYACSNGGVGDMGTFDFYGLQQNANGMTGSFTQSSSSLGCQHTGWFGTMWSGASN